MSEKKPIKQIHTDLPLDMYKKFINTLPEERMVSLAVRCLILNYLSDVKEGESPWMFLTKAKKASQVGDADGRA